MAPRTSYKRWRDALRLEVMREHPDGGVKLSHIARAVVRRALAGDMQAVREIGDRLDGRPTQRLALDGRVSLVGLLAELSAPPMEGDAAPLIEGRPRPLPPMPDAAPMSPEIRRGASEAAAQEPR